MPGPRSSRKRGPGAWELVRIGFTVLRCSHRWLPLQDFAYEGCCVRCNAWDPADGRDDEGDSIMFRVKVPIAKVTGRLSSKGGQGKGQGKGGKATKKTAAKRPAAKAKAKGFAEKAKAAKSEATKKSKKTAAAKRPAKAATSSSSTSGPGT